MSTGDEMIKRWRERMYGKPGDVLESFHWEPGLKPSTTHGYHEGWRDRKKPFLTAADLVMLREMRIGL